MTTIRARDAREFSEFSKRNPGFSPETECVGLIFVSFYGRPSVRNNARATGLPTDGPTEKSHAALDDAIASSLYNSTAIPLPIHPAPDAPRAHFHFLQRVSGISFVFSPPFLPSFQPVVCAWGGENARRKSTDFRRKRSFLFTSLLSSHPLAPNACQFTSRSNRFVFYNGSFWFSRSVRPYLLLQCPSHRETVGNSKVSREDPSSDVTNRNIRRMRRQISVC